MSSKPLPPKFTSDMIITRFLLVQPSELKFPFELNKVCSCSIQLTNRTDKDVAFKVKTTHPKKYCVRPNLGIVSAGSKCVVEVIMQPQKTTPVLRKDKFLVQSRLAFGKKCEDVTSEMFRKEVGNDMQEQRLRVVFVNANPPSPIPEASEEGSSSEASEFENSELLSCRRTPFSNDARNGRVSDLQVEASSVEESRSLNQQIHEPSSDHEESISEDWDWNETISKLMEEKCMAVRECSKLHYEWDKMRQQARRSNNGNSTFYVLFVIVVFIGFVLGYMVG